VDIIKHKQLVEQVEGVANQAAVFIRQHFGTVGLGDADTKSAKSYVSEVDRGAERIIVEGLRKIYPEAGFITEEGTVAQERKSAMWIIDPLDGTTNFLYGIPFVAVSIALKIDGIVRLGVVTDVIKGVSYKAIEGGGAFKGDMAIHVSGRRMLKDALIATGFPYEFSDTTEKQLDALRRVIHVCNGVRRFGSAALDLAMVAEGIFDGYFEYALEQWDTAGGMLLVREAGGVCTNRAGDIEYQDGLEVVASNGIIHKEFLKLLEGA
jgi:myo-inositol-1(or 4)-monophosphatase